MRDGRRLNQRQHKEELKENREALTSEGQALREIGGKLALDKKRIDELREAIQESGLPEEDMRAQLAELDEQEKALRKQWEEDVDRPQEKLETDMNVLSEESGELAESAAKAESKLSGFKAESRMDTSSIQSATRRQQENIQFFTQEQQEMISFKEEQGAELKRILASMDA